MLFWSQGWIIGRNVFWLILFMSKSVQHLLLLPSAPPLSSCGFICTIGDVGYSLCLCLSRVGKNILQTFWKDQAVTGKSQNWHKYTVYKAERLKCTWSPFLKGQLPQMSHCQIKSLHSCAITLWANNSREGASATKHTYCLLFINQPN